MDLGEVLPDRSAPKFEVPLGLEQLPRIVGFGLRGGNGIWEEFAPSLWPVLTTAHGTSHQRRGVTPAATICWLGGPGPANSALGHSGVVGDGHLDAPWARWDALGGVGGP